MAVNEKKGATMSSKQVASGQRHGFTIVELLVVISIIAVVATLATGAAMKSIRKVRDKKIDAMAQALEMALQNYRTRENQWPFQLSQLTLDPKTNDYFAYSNKNYVAFQKLLTSSTKYLDTSSLTTASDGRMSVQQALEKDISQISIGYPDPGNTANFQYFTVRYYPLTDRVKVTRQ